MTPPQLSEKMRDGALWVYLQNGGVTGLQFISGIVLARILDPSDFGVFVAATAFTALFSNQVTFGIPSALVQAKAISDRQIHTAFWLMQGIAVVCTLLVIALSLLLTDAYEDPRHAAVMQLMCIMFFFLPFVNITNTLLRREMNFKAISKIRIQATLLTLPVGIVFALLDFGPYSLVISGIAAVTVTVLLLARYKPWLPRFHVSAPGMGRLLGYAWRTNVNSSLDILGDRVDNMLVGSALGAHALGIYARAYSLARLPVEQLAQSLEPLLLGGLARIQDDLHYTRSMYQKATCALALGVFPFILLFILVADSFIAVVYGEKWLTAALPLKIMAVGAFALLLSSTLRSLVAAQNLVGREMPLQLAKVAITVVILIAAIPGGLTAVAIGISIREFIFLALLKRMIGKAGLGLNVRAILYAAMPATIACGAAGGLALLAHWLMTPAISPTSLLYLTSISTILFGAYAAAIALLTRRWASHAPLQASMGMLCDVLIKLPAGSHIARILQPNIGNQS